MNAVELYQAGDLQGAITAATQHLKSKPTDEASRLLLAELLCFSGDIERAEKQLDVISRQSTQGAVTLALYRQLLRGEAAREQVLREGRTPEVVQAPLPKDCEVMLEALMALRLGQQDDAIRLQQEASQQRAPVPGICNDQPFDDFRDLDDRLAGVLEVITNQGKYYWVPWASIHSLEMEAPQVPMDLLYRRTQIDVQNGPQGEVYVPTRYLAGADEEQRDALLLCRATEWVGEEGKFVQGRGLRTFLAGDADMTIMEIKTLSFAKAKDD